MPRVLFFTSLTLWSMGKGNGGPAFTQTVKKYIDEGWEVFLISDEASNEDYPYLDRAHNIVLKPTGLKRYEQVRKLGFLFRWLNHISMTGRFVRTGAALLKQEAKETVLYAYEIFGVAACRRLARRFKLPFVTRFQGTILSQFKNTFINRLARYPHYQALSTKADLVIMTDDGTQGDRVLKELQNKSNTLFLRNGLDLMTQDVSQMYQQFPREQFRTQLGVKAEETMFLTVSRLVDWKKVDRAIDGFGEFCKKGKEGRLVIVGDGSSRPALEQRAKDLGIADRVIFVGSVPHDRVYDYMMACDVFLSLYDLSNVGNPLLEAMTLGKGIVTLDVGDTRKLITDHQTGILLSYKTLHSLGDVLAELAGDPKLREELGAAAAQYAQTNFQTWQARMNTEFQAICLLLKAESLS